MSPFKPGFGRRLYNQRLLAPYSYLTGLGVHVPHAGLPRRRRDGGLPLPQGRRPGRSALRPVAAQEVIVVQRRAGQGEQRGQHGQPSHTYPSFPFPNAMALPSNLTDAGSNRVIILFTPVGNLADLT